MGTMDTQASHLHPIQPAVAAVPAAVPARDVTGRGNASRAVVQERFMTGVRPVSSQSRNTHTTVAYVMAEAAVAYATAKDTTDNKRSIYNINN